MRKQNFNLLIGMAMGIYLVGLLSSCNPQCDSPFTVVVKSPVNAMGSEILLQASNSLTDQLRSRAVYVNNQPLSSDQVQFVEGLGLIVRMPDNLNGNVNLEVEDYDCGPLGYRSPWRIPAFSSTTPITSCPPS